MNTETSANVESKRRRERLFEEAVLINLFNSNEKTLSPVNGDFLYGQRLIEVLTRMERSDNDQRELIDLCKDIYRDDPAELTKLTDYTSQTQLHSAVWWYTRDSCLFKLLNKSLRVQDVDKLFAFRSFIQDLSQQLKELYQQGQTIAKVYRFQLMKADEIARIYNNAGQYLSVNSFMSTSVNENYPKFLLSSVLANPTEVDADVRPVIFRISIDLDNKTSRPFADVTRESYFPDEQEILFAIGCIFQVMGTSDEKTHWIIDLRLCGENENQLREAYEFMQKKTEWQTTLESLAKLLRETGKYEQAKKYYEKFLTQSDPSSKEAGYSYQGLGLIADHLGDYDQAIHYFEKHLQLHQNRANNHFEIANALQNLAISYDAKGDHSRALKYYRDALSLKLELFGENHTLIADLYYNIGITCGVQGNTDEALKHYQLALKIYEKELPADHLDIANVISNIGSCYEDKQDLDQALELYEKALTIKLKTLPTNHEYIGREFCQIGHIHLLKKNFSEASDYLRKAKTIYEQQGLLPTHVDVINVERYLEEIKNAS